MCAPSAPPPPDPVRTAQAQGALNKETAQYQTQLNMVDQSGPFGSLAYRPTGDQIQTTQFDQDAYDKDLNHWRVVGLGGTPNEQWAKPDASGEKYLTTINEGPRYEAVTTLSPEQQQLADQRFGLNTSLLDVGQNQLNRVDNALSSPMSMQNLPSLQVQVPGIQGAGQISRVGNTPQQQTSFNSGGNVGNVGNGPQMQLSNNIPQLSGGFNTGPALQRAGSGPQMARTGAAPQLGGSFNRGGAASDIGNDDYGDDRMRVEQALMDRMQPYMDQRREQERTRLINQGFSDPNSEGYSDAMDEVYRAENDARLGAILNAGQEQERLFGMELAGTGFNNQAQAQRYGQNLTAQDFQNNARLQQQQSQMAAKGFNNQVSQAEYANNMAGMQANNAAAGQQFGQNMTAQDFQNQARQQAFANSQEARDFNNQARQQQYANTVGATGFNNQAQQQRFGQNATQAAFGNDARNQGFQNQLAATGFNNQAQSQQFGQNVAQQQAATARAEHINRARQQAIQERVMQRQMPMNEIAALMSQSQVSMPQFVSTPQTGVQAPDYQAAVYANYQGQLENADRQAEMQNALTQGLFSLGGSALGGFGGAGGFQWLLS